MPSKNYNEFLERKAQNGQDSGFAPKWMPSQLFDFQQSLVEWSLQKGRAAVFADCGLGKTPIQLTWAQNIVERTNKRVLIITPLAVSSQTVREGEKFGIECNRSKDGIADKKITVTNYESLHKFNANDFIGVVCDESSAIKNFDGTHRKLVTEFLRQMPYRLLCTATAAPNDYIELGTSSEALGELGYMDMLGRFFKNDQHSLHPTSGRHFGRAFEDGANKWRFKRHAEQPFWRWMCSWARACRMPSDLGFDNGRFILPKLIERCTVVKSATPMPGFLFELPAVGLKEQRDELRHTLNERCETAAQKLMDGRGPGVAWCQLNTEGDLLERLIPEARQVKGSQDDDEKEEILTAFTSGQLRLLIIKPKIGAWGMNWQHCARMTYFSSHSFEQYYQSLRRFYRFGQTNEVVAELITTEGQRNVLGNLQRKAEAAEKMFQSLVAHMNGAIKIQRSEYSTQEMEQPKWNQQSKRSQSLTTNTPCTTMIA